MSSVFFYIYTKDRKFFLCLTKLKAYIAVDSLFIMKRLFFLILILTLPLIAFFEWAAYKRANFPADFIYTTSDSVDLDYHRPEVVADYFQSAAAIERFGRYCWKEYKVDVRADEPMESPEKELVASYLKQLVHLRQTEARLKQSYSLKQQGLDAETIQRMIENGWDKTTYEAQTFLGDKKVLVFEDQGEAVFKVQQLLKKKGYDLPVDGYFERKTLDAVKEFQRKEGLFPTGRIGDLTVKRLLK